MRESHPGYRANIKAEMARRDLTLADIAQVLGISVQSTSQRLLGKTPLRVDELLTLAAYFGVTASELLGPVATAAPERVAS